MVIVMLTVLTRSIGNFDQERQHEGKVNYFINVSLGMCINNSILQSLDVL